MLEAASCKALSLVLDGLAVDVNATNETVNEPARRKSEAGNRQTRFISTLKFLADRHH